jgi:hypothetical protein
MQSIGRQKPGNRNTQPYNGVYRGTAIWFNADHVSGSLLAGRVGKRAFTRK